nr:Hint domain-containing protein [Methylorubrum extorquens]
MSSGPAPSATYNTYVELTPTDAAASSFRVGNIMRETSFTITDGGNGNGVLGDTPNESAAITSDPPGFFITPRDYTYWGKSSDNGTIVRFSPARSPDGFGYILFSNGTSYSQFDVVPSSSFSQEANALCFVSGTRILTTRGAIAVEDLQIGDTAVTASGRHRPITWIGQRQLGSDSRPMPADQAPVQIRAGAFGPGLPARDLFLSPGHPVLVGADADGQGGVLVPVMCLINGTSIARTDATSVVYWHVELDAHDILLAEGLHAESFLDFGCRPFFEGASDHALHNPDFVPPGLAGRCRPVAVDGPLVKAERARLDALFVQALTDHCAWAEGVIPTAA